MAIRLVSDGAFSGRNAPQDRAPMPADAAGYVDFTSGLHMTQADVSTSDAAAIVLSTVQSVSPGYYYDAAGVIQRTTASRWSRIEYDPVTGMPFGRRPDGPFTQRIIAAHRQNLAAGASVGAVIAASGSAAQPWQQWYSVTPSGAGEASLTFDTVAIATAGSFLYISVDVRAGGIVQVGSAGTGHANFNTRTGAVQAFDGARAQIIRRPGGAMTLHVRAVVPTGGLENAGVYAASVAALDTPKRGASGEAFQIIAPRLFTGTSGSLPFAGVWPDTASDSHSAEGIVPIYPGWTSTADFSAIATLRAGNLPQSNAALFTLNTGSTGVDLRLLTAGTFGLINRTGNGLLWDSGVRYTPGAVYRIGVSRTAGRLAVVLDGVGTETTTPTVTGVLRIGAHSSTTQFQWSGHIEKVIYWADGRSQDRLAALCDQWL